jgi:NAD(P)-dependent dehydrogenase (short-subunit alcohol dehydrogenase family)
VASAGWAGPKSPPRAVRYLCSDDARYMTGAMLVLDGGYTAQ